MAQAAPSSHHGVPRRPDGWLQVLKRIDLLARERGLEELLVLDLIEKRPAPGGAPAPQVGGNLTVSINYRDTGEIHVLDDPKPIDMEEFGRIATNVAVKQVFADAWAN